MIERGSECRDLSVPGGDRGSLEDWSGHSPRAEDAGGGCAAPGALVGGRSCGRPDPEQGAELCGRPDGGSSHVGRPDPEQLGARTQAPGPRAVERSHTGMPTRAPGPRAVERWAPGPRAVERSHTGMPTRLDRLRRRTEGAATSAAHPPAARTRPGPHQIEQPLPQHVDFQTRPSARHRRAEHRTAQTSLARFAASFAAGPVALRPERRSARRAIRAAHTFQRGRARRARPPASPTTPRDTRRGTA